ncbi:MAG: PIN domain-containing protein [Nanoarchaeota archaeon]
MHCLDTYALIEIAEGNPKFSFLLKGEFIIPSTTLAEFYWVLLRDKGNEEANYWIERLMNSSTNVLTKTLVKAQNFRYLNKKKDISFFDCVGYIFAQENNYLFVTGDKEFKNLSGVKFISK